MLIKSNIVATFSSRVSCHASVQSVRITPSHWWDCEIVKLFYWQVATHSLWKPYDGDQKMILWLLGVLMEQFMCGKWKQVELKEQAISFSKLMKIQY